PAGVRDRISGLPALAPRLAPRTHVPIVRLGCDRNLSQPRAIASRIRQLLHTERGGMSSGLVLVSGLPAAGKSTLARRLALELGWPLISRDRLNVTAFDAIRERIPPDEMWRIGRTLDLVINEVAGQALDAGVGAVIDSNFNWVEQADAVRRLINERAVDCF